MIEDSKYFNIHPMTKLIYGILEDRNRLPIDSGWVDEQGRIFFLFNKKIFVNKIIKILCLNIIIQLILLTIIILT